MKTLGLKEAHTMLKVSRETMLALADSGHVPGAKVGKAWVFDEDDLAEYLRAQISDQTQARRDNFDTPKGATKQRVATAFTVVRTTKRARRASKLPDLERAERDAAERKAGATP